MGKSVEVEQLRAALQRQRQHNKLAENSLRAEREYRKALQADYTRMLKRFKTLLRYVEFGSSAPKEKVLEELDPGRLISSGALL